MNSQSYYFYYNLSLIFYWIIEETDLIFYNIFKIIDKYIVCNINIIFS